MGAGWGGLEARGELYLLIGLLGAVMSPKSTCYRPRHLTRKKIINQS